MLSGLLGTRSPFLPSRGHCGDIKTSVSANAALASLRCKWVHLCFYMILADKKKKKEKEFG
jgi:hypothetical protein